MKAYFSKLAAVFLAIAMLAMCIAGCGGNGVPDATVNGSDHSSAASDSSDPQQPAEEVTITFWHTYGDSEEAQFLNVVMPLWEKAHPEIKVEAVRQDSSQYHQMIVTS